MLKKQFFLCLFLLTIALPVLSQATSESTYTIKGEVVDSITGETIPLHDGAQKYYSEQGLI